MKIVGTGLQGLIGSRIVEFLQNRYEFQNISRSTGVDISNREQVFTAVKDSGADVVLHLAAKADVDGCEEDRIQDIEKLRNKEIGEEELFTGQTSAYSLNVWGTKNIVDACKETNKKLIYFSTDFVFDGGKGNYTEEDKTHPMNWYGETKKKGEEIVLASNGEQVVLRLAYPFGRSDSTKKDFVRAILARLQSGQNIKVVTDHIFTPTYMDDIAKAIDLVIKNNSKGIFHVVGSQSLTPFDAAALIAKTFELDSSLVGKTTRNEFFAGKAQRPYNLSLRNDRIKTLGLVPRTFERGLLDLKTVINV